MYKISNMTFSHALQRDRERGLFGYISFLYGGLRLDGITLRKTMQGKWTLSFPERIDPAGFRHPIIRPIDDESRLEIEHEVYGQLIDVLEDFSS